MENVVEMMEKCGKDVVLWKNVEKCGVDVENVEVRNSLFLSRVDNVDDVERIFCVVGND